MGVRTRGGNSRPSGLCGQINLQTKRLDKPLCPSACSPNHLFLQAVRALPAPSLRLGGQDGWLSSPLRAGGGLGNTGSGFSLTPQSFPVHCGGFQRRKYVEFHF